MTQPWVYLAFMTAVPVPDEVVAAVIRYLREDFYHPGEPVNPSRRVRDALREARSRVARLLGADPEDILFTSSATESNNLAVQGLARASADRGRRLLISSQSDLSVIHSARALEREGFHFDLVPTDAAGRTSPETLTRMITGDTVLVSFPHAGAESGAVQPVRDLAAAARQRGCLFHLDASWTAGVLPLDVRQTVVDAVTLHGPTFYAPKGAAALYLNPERSLLPLMYGGDQEQGYRPGMEIVPNWIGMGVAAEWILARRARWETHVHPLMVRLIERIRAATESLGVRLVGPPPGPHRLPYHAAFAVPGAMGEVLLIDLEARGVLAGSGSACGRMAQKRSPALEAMGIHEALARGLVTFTAPLEVDAAAIDRAAEVFIDAVRRHRSGSPGIPE